MWSDLVFGKECVADAGQQHHADQEGYDSSGSHDGQAELLELVVSVCLAHKDDEMGWIAEWEAAEL